MLPLRVGGPELSLKSPEDPNPEPPNLSPLEAPHDHAPRLSGAPLLLPLLLPKGGVEGRDVLAWFCVADCIVYAEKLSRMR